MTIPEAVTLVLQSAAFAQTGEIHILDMGAPVKILDLATQMITLSGFTPHTDIEIVFTGLRPGEKLYEELSQGNEEITGTDHPKISRLVAPPLPKGDINAHLATLTDALYHPEILRELLAVIVPEYRPFTQPPTTPAPPIPPAAEPLPHTLAGAASA